MVITVHLQDQLDSAAQDIWVRILHLGNRTVQQDHILEQIFRLMILIKASEHLSVEIIKIVTDVLLDIIPGVHSLFQLEQQTFRNRQMLLPAEPVGELFAFVGDVRLPILRLTRLNVCTHVLIREAEGDASCIWHKDAVAIQILEHTADIVVLGEFTLVPDELKTLDMVLFSIARQNRGKEGQLLFFFRTQIGVGLAEQIVQQIFIRSGVRCNLRFLIRAYKRADDQRITLGQIIELIALGMLLHGQVIGITCISKLPGIADLAATSHMFGAEVGKFCSFLLR